MPKKPLKKSKSTSKEPKKLKKTATKKVSTAKRVATKASPSKTKPKVAAKSKTAKSAAKTTSSTKGQASKVQSKKITSKNSSKNAEKIEIVGEKRKAGRPPKNSDLSNPQVNSAKSSSSTIVSNEPKKRGRPKKIVSEAEMQEAAAAKAAGPKKRGRKSKAELEAIAQGLDPSTVVKKSSTNSDGSGAGNLPLGQAIKRKRGRPRKNEQYGAGGAVLNSELMARGIRRFGIPNGGSDVPVARYSWSAETGEHLNPKTANFSSADSGTEIFSNDEVEFSKSDKVVYPAHGLGVVQAIQSRMVSGAQQKFYMILIIETGMKIMVPVSQAKTVGLRRVVDHSTVDRVYAILKDKNVSIDNQTWNRRYREYSQKIKTGSVLEIASVIRDLTVLKVEKELSFNERRMLDTAQGLLVKELSIAKSSTEEIIKEELDQICQF